MHPGRDAARSPPVALSICLTSFTSVRSFRFHQEDVMHTRFVRASLGVCAALVCAVLAPRAVGAQATWRGLWNIARSLQN